MATQVVYYRRELLAGPDVIALSEERVRKEFGRELAGISHTGKRAIYRRLREWFEDESRPGQFAFQNHRGKKDVERHIAVFISDPKVRFEFKMRWA